MDQYYLVVNGLEYLNANPVPGLEYIAGRAKVDVIFIDNAGLNRVRF